MLTEMLDALSFIDALTSMHDEGIEIPKFHHIVNKQAFSIQSVRNGAIKDNLSSELWPIDQVDEHHASAASAAQPMPELSKLLMLKEEDQFSQ